MRCTPQNSRQTGLNVARIRIPEKHKFYRICVDLPSEIALVSGYEKERLHLPQGFRERTN
jgi:hypothetical protein